MRSLAHMLLALLLTMTSPAWCACAFAEIGMAGSNRAGDGCADACCPAADDDCGPITETSGDEPAADQSLPCRDRSDCTCCDSLTIVGTTSSSAWSNDALARAAFDIAPIPPTIVEIQWTGGSADSWRLLARGAPPWLPASASPLAQRCLLLI